MLAAIESHTKNQVAVVKRSLFLTHKNILKSAQKGNLSEAINNVYLSDTI